MGEGGGSEKKIPFLKTQIRGLCQVMLENTIWDWKLQFFLQKALFPIFYDRFQIFFQKVKVAKHWICLLGLIFSLKIKYYAKFFFENLL